MKVTFDHRPGEIFDFFRSLWFANNFEFIKEYKKDYGIEKTNVFENSIEEVIDSSIIDKEKLAKYFHKELKPEYFIGVNDMWKYLSVENYLDFTKDFSKFDLISRMEQAARIISYNEIEFENESHIKDLEKLIENILDIVTESDISVELKWEISLFLREPKEYIKELGDLVEEFIPLYKRIIYKRKKVISLFNKELEENVRKVGLSYLEKKLSYSYDFSKFEEIKITTTALMGLQIYSEGTTCYVLIGPSIEEGLLNIQSEDIIDKNLKFIKGISELARYKILQLLSKRKYYGQELSDALNITKPTTFYHLNYLVSIGAVKLEKDSQKNYYMINKEELLKNMEFFKNNLSI